VNGSEVEATARLRPWIAQVQAVSYHTTDPSPYLKLLMSNLLATTSTAAAQRPLFLGVDVGGTSVKIGLVDDRGRTLGLTKIPTFAERSPDDAVRRISAACLEFLQSLSLAMTDVAAIGLGTPGTMDIPRGMILEPPNIPGWRNYPIRDRLSDALGLPVAFANDATAAAFGEWWIGTGHQHHSIVLLTLGTGVGGGIIVGDMSIDGENSCGSECGHIIIDFHEDARLCGCGQRGHLEAYGSATAVVKRTNEILAAGGTGLLAERAAAGHSITPLLIAEAADAGDPLALDIVLETARYLGIGITSLMHTIDPSAVILGGAMNFGGPDHPLGRKFLERIRQEVRARAFPVLARRTTIEFASLGGDAGYIGAAGIARTFYRKQT